MLQRILRDLYVDPEILAGLNDDQKQTLFCRMREEQVRRWAEWDRKSSSPKATPPSATKKKKKKSVSFLKGIDGEPWVWVMGEHENDKSIEQIIKEEAMDKARKLAQLEAQHMRKHLSDYIEDLPPLGKSESVYASVDEIKSPSLKNLDTLSPFQQQQMFNNKLNAHSVLNEINSRNKMSCKVAQKVVLWEQRLTEERTCEILQKMQAKRMQVDREAEESEQRHEKVWLEQQRRAKEAELQMREVARKARAEHRLSRDDAIQVEAAYSAMAPGVPPGKGAVLEWYKKQEVPKNAGLRDAKTPESYFHGLITRAEAESLLVNQEEGTFLVRLSERLWGYAISYKTVDSCKHYLVNAASGKYCFLGNNQTEHQSLDQLIKYHTECPLSGGEKLLKPCPAPKTSETSVIETLLGSVSVQDDASNEDEDERTHI